MTVKTLQVEVTQYQTGWHQDPLTGEYYYYNASAGQWYIYAAGYLYPMATKWEYGRSPINVAVGDLVTMEVTFNYQGTAKEVRLYGAIGFGTTDTGTGNDSGQFMEGGSAMSPSFTVEGDGADPRSYRKTVDVLVPDRVVMYGYYVSTPGHKCSIYCKIVDSVSLELYKTLSTQLAGVLEVTGVEPIFSNLVIADYNKKA